MRKRANSNAPINWDGLPLAVSEFKASEITGFSVSYFRKSRSEGAPGNRTAGPPYVKDGKCVLYKVKDLLEWVEQLETRRVV